MRSIQIMSDPMFTLAMPSGRQLGSLFDLFAGAAAGDLRDLPRLPAHLRAPVVTSLAGTMAALQMHAPAPLRTAADWERAWMEQVGPESLRLIAPAAEPAFFQPPVASTSEPRPVEELGPPNLGPRHAAKASVNADAEQWTYGLMSAQWRAHMGVGQYAGVRAGLTVVLPSQDGTIGSEIRTLREAYLAHRPITAGTAAKPTGADDHLLWLRPWTGDTRPLPVDHVPYPVIDARPVRLLFAGGTIEGRAYTVSGRRIHDKALLEDPHVPLIADGKGWKPYALVKSRRADMRFFAHVLLGGKGHRVPPILGETQYRTVRVCAIGTDQGKTLGYWEQQFSLSPTGGFSLDLSADRPGELAELIIEVREQVSRALWSVLTVLYDIDSKHDPRRGLAEVAARELDRTTVVDVIETAASRLDQDPAGDRGALMGVLIPPPVDIVHRAMCAPHDRLCVARAEIRMRDAVSKLTGGQPMKREMPHLARQTYAVLTDIEGHLDEADRVALRAMLPSAPHIEYYRILSHVPRAQADDTGAEAVWRLVLGGLGELRGTGRGIGRALAGTGYAEDRASRLVTASGGHLRSEIAAAIDWLVAHDLSSAALWQVATLGIADALGDQEALQWARREIAMDYVR
jgi:hypothetical protein